MTITQQTVEYPIGINTATLAAATRYDFSAITVYIPETTSRAFRSVWAEVAACDAQAATATRANLSSFLTGAKLGAAAFSDTTTTTTLTDSGEQTSWIVTSPDWSSYFGTNFGAGSSQTFQLGFQFGTSSTTNPVILANICGKLIVTYDADDSGDTKIKTVRIPLESSPVALSGTLTEIGANQIPALDSFLEEGGKVYRAIWFEIEGNESNASAVDYQLAVALDSEAETAFGLVEQANSSSGFHRYVWIRNDLTTSAAHAFKARIVTGSAGHNHLRVTLCVTYEYSESASTRITNQIALPFADPSFQWGNSATQSKRIAWRLWLSEPGTLALKQSAIAASWSMATVSNPAVRCGGQTARVYTAALGSVASGCYALQQRIDAGAAGGAGVTLGGDGAATDLTVDIYTGTSGRITAWGGLVWLTYSSDKSSSGSRTHAHTVRKLIQGSVATATASTPTATIADLPEASPSVIAVGFSVGLVGTLAAAAQEWVEVELASGEGDGDGYAQLINQYHLAGNETGFRWSWGCSAVGPAPYRWRRWPGDQAKWLDPGASHNFRLQRSQTMIASLDSWVTYSRHKFEAAGNVTGSSGGTVTIGLHDATTGELLQQTTRTGNGAYSLTWGDARPLFVEARESGALLARSDTASGARVAS